MNILQSFMGCMYPGSIRTESIESIEPDYRHYSFPARNVDQYGNKISEGELQITNEDLIYFKPSKPPTRWQLSSIRRYGCTPEGSKFVFESGRSCSTGEAVYAFMLNQNAHDLVKKLSEKISKLPAPTTPTSPSPSQASQRQCGFGIGINPMRRLQKDASTLTDQNTSSDSPTSTDPRPLSYTMIDFDTTKALNKLAQAHAANRDR